MSIPSFSHIPMGLVAYNVELIECLPRPSHRLVQFPLIHFLLILSLIERDIKDPVASGRSRAWLPVS